MSQNTNTSPIRGPSIDNATADEWAELHRAKLGVQPAPIASAHPASWGLVISDMAARNTFGRNKYGVPLQPGNGRDALMDAYEEALDLCVYLRTAIYERDHKLKV